MFDVANVLDALARQRPIFHSEADFQHALAWELHQRLPHASVRLELPLLVGDQWLHLDVWVQQGEQVLAVELKYKVRELSVRRGDEQFTLRGHAAQDTGRYDFVKDIQRLERVATTQKGCLGYAIFLTNDSSYWTVQQKAQPADDQFRLHEGRTLHGPLGWGPKASDGTKRSRETPLSLGGTYTLRWADYAHPSPDRYGQFRYLAVKVAALDLACGPQLQHL